MTNGDSSSSISLNNSYISLILVDWWMFLTFKWFIKAALDGYPFTYSMSAIFNNSFFACDVSSINSDILWGT